jgi:hypothetical protein
MAAELTRAERDRLVGDYDRLVRAATVFASQPPPHSPEVRAAVKEHWKRVSDALAEYFDRLPRLPLSRCPHCGQVLARAFDPWGLDGLWWQPSEGGKTTEPEACPHFRLLQGAVNLNDLPPHAGRYGVRPGPEVPYVIPRILELPTMIAVFASVPLACGYTTYPIAYFSQEQPRTGSLTQPWLHRQYSFTDDRGNPAWTIKNDPWDFDLLPWVERGKLQWINPGDSQFVLQTNASVFPYRDLPGRREQLFLQGTVLTTSPPPSGQRVDPFSG